MTDKFSEYYSNPDRICELSDYVHENFKLIMTKMVSEMRRKLDISPDMSNIDGYASLMISLAGRLFNEMVYSLAGYCQGLHLKPQDVIPVQTFLILFDLIEGKNILNGGIRTDVTNDLEGFQRYYRENIDELRKCIKALPK